MIKKQDKSLGTLLLQAEYIKKEQLECAASNGYRQPLGKILMKGAIREQQIMEVLGDACIVLGMQ